jgi:hypothetical protein
MKIHPRQLQHTFSKHGLDFGISGPWDSTTAALLEKAIQDHVNNPAVQKIAGTYRGTIVVTHYFDPATGVNVMLDSADDFIGGWKLSGAQKAHLLASGNVQ